MSTTDRKDRLVASLDLSEVNAVAGFVEAANAPMTEAPDSAITERNARADARILRFLDQSAQDDEPGPTSAAPVTDAPAKEPGPTLDAMRKRWLAQSQRVAQLSMENHNFPEQARRFIWLVYLRKRKITTIDECIFVFNLALFYFGESSEKIASDDFWRTFFSKIEYCISDAQDENGLSLPDYIAIQDAGIAVFLIPCIEDLCAWALRQPQARAGDARNFVHRTFTAPRPILDRPILDQLRAALDPGMVKRAERALDALAATADARDGGAEAPGIDETLTRLIAEGRRQEATEHARKHARALRPETIADIYAETKIDLFRLDIAERGEGEAQRGSLLRGALASHFAKSGLYSTDHARLRLVRELTGLSQGRIDQRGRNNYMQIAAQRDYNPAYIENEHAFWDHMLTQMATEQAERPEDDEAVAALELVIARDLLDRPDVNGMTAMLLAARSGNTMVLKYVLNRVTAFRAALALRRMAAQPGQSARSTASLKQAHLEELRENLPQILVADKDGANAFMHALQTNRADSISILLSHLRDFPEYIRFISQFKISLDGKSASLIDYCDVDFGFGRSTEAQRMLQRVLSDATRQAGR